MARCYQYFLDHKYQLSMKNYSYLMVNFAVWLIINLIIGFSLYSDILVILLFAVNSELIAATICFHYNTGKSFGPLALSIEALLVSFKLFDFNSLVLKLVLMSLVTIMAFFMGVHIGLYKFVEYDRIREPAAKVRKPVQRLDEESYVN